MKSPKNLFIYFFFVGETKFKEEGNSVARVEALYIQASVMSKL